MAEGMTKERLKELVYAADLHLGLSQGASRQVFIEVDRCHKRIAELEKENEHMRLSIGTCSGSCRIPDDKL